MKNVVYMTLVLGTALVFLSARDSLACKGDKQGKSAEKQPLMSLSLTGTVASVQRELTKKDGSVDIVTVYYLQTDNGNIELPAASGCKKDDQPSYSLSELNGATVKVNAQGFIRQHKDGAKRTHIDHITSIKRVAAATEA